MRWLPWDLAWQEALYGAGGFYRSDAPAAHFATPAQGVPGGGELLAEALVALARRHDLGRVVEVGAGGGELLIALHALAPDLALTGFDIGPRPAALGPSGGDRAGIDWRTAPGGAWLPPSFDGGLADRRHEPGVPALVVAVEWLDVVPCTVAEVDGAGTPRRVEVEMGSGRERLGDIMSEEELGWSRRYWPLDGAPEGTRAEIGLTRDRAWADLVRRTRHGVSVAIDYGHLGDHRPPAGSLTGYRRGAQVLPVPDGSCDLTAHLAVDSLTATSRLTQRDAFDDLGLRAELPDQALAVAEPARYLAALARASALAAMRSPGGLGGFWWVVHQNG